MVDGRGWSVTITSRLQCAVLSVEEEIDNRNRLLDLAGRN